MRSDSPPGSQGAASRAATVTAKPGGGGGRSPGRGGGRSPGRGGKGGGEGDAEWRARGAERWRCSEGRRMCVESSDAPAHRRLRYRVPCCGWQCIEAPHLLDHVCPLLHVEEEEALVAQDSLIVDDNRACLCWELRSIERA